MWGVVLDIMIWSLPIPRVWSLQMRLALKVALTGVFSLGLLYVLSISDFDSDWILT